jgi:hypothetical protein
MNVLGEVVRVVNNRIGISGGCRKHGSTRQDGLERAVRSDRDNAETADMKVERPWPAAIGVKTTMSQIIWMILFLAAVGSAGYLSRISVVPSTNAGVVYVTDRWTGSVYTCSSGPSGACQRVFSR